MKIEEILPFLRRGEKIRRKEWDKNQYLYQKDGIIFDQDDDNYYMHGYDLTSGDWEIYKEPIDWNYIIEHKCLCWFWDNKYKFRVLGLLTKYDKNKTCPFSYKHLTLNTYFGNYKNCKPVKKSELNFYEDKEDE